MALEAPRDLQPALLPLDLRLPDLHGSELLPLLRRMPGCEHAPAVAVTADAADDVDAATVGLAQRIRKSLPKQVRRRVPAT